MKSSTNEIIPIIGTSMGGGYYAGRIRLDDGTVYALIVAPKEEGEHKPAQWIGRNKGVPGALSYNDGLANTIAMAEAGSKLADWARDLRIDGYDDWYMPSQDELEIMYRNLKPTAQQNYCWGRSGINVSAVTTTYPYTPDFPAQTQAELFMGGAGQAFDAEWYWSSTQHASDSVFAWLQNFYYGIQYVIFKRAEGRARAVRRSFI